MSYVQAERLLQTEIALRLRGGAWPEISIPVPNGIWIPARNEAERALVARMVTLMKADRMLLPGAPDLVLLWAGGGAMVELKRPKGRDLFGTRPAGRPSEAQTTIAARAAQLGIRHAYCSSWDDVRARLAEWGGGLLHEARHCQWCNRPFTSRRTGGHDQRFCRPSCRRAFHAGARSWVLAELAAGRLTVPQIRNGIPATCALATEGGIQRLTPEAAKTFDALVSDLLAALPEDAWLALPDQVLDQISDYLDSAG